MIVNFIYIYADILGPRLYTVAIGPKSPIKPVYKHRPNIYKHISY